MVRMRRSAGVAFPVWVRPPRKTMDITSPFFVVPVIAAALFVVVPGHAGTKFAQDYAPVIFGGLAVAGAATIGLGFQRRIAEYR